MKRFSWIIASVAVATVMVVTGTCAWAAKPIKVGFVDTYSGPASTYTLDVLDGFKLVVDKVNAQGGLLGHKIEYTTRDDKFKVNLALSQTRELIMREGVNVLMGTINSASALAISNMAKKYRVPYFDTFAKSAKISGAKGNRYVFQITENTALAGKAAAIGLAKKPYVTYWIAGDDYEYGHALADALWQQLKAIKPDVKLLGQSWWKVGEPDFTPYITSILEAKPDAVIVATGGRDCVPFLKAAKATGFNKKVPFYMHTAIGLSTLRPLGLEAPQGVLGTINYLYYYPDTPANKAFVAAFKKKYGRVPEVGALYGYLAATYLVDGYKKAGSVDTEKLIDAIQGMTVDSPVGKVTLRAYDHQAMLPTYLGVTTKEPGHKVLMATDLVTIPAQEAAPSIAEVKKARGQ